MSNLDKSIKDTTSVSNNHFSLQNRSDKDRRRNKLPGLRFLLYQGKRENIRRAEDQHKTVILDRYHPKLFSAIVIILFLSVIDALLTLHLVENGSSELNPVMAYFLQHGPLVFMLVKYMLTSCSVVILLIFKSVFLSRAKIYTHTLFIFAIVGFSIVIAWEVFLICVTGI